MMDKKVDRMKKALMRSNTRLLLSAVLLFQFVSALLLTFKGDTIDMQALLFTFAIPAVTWLVCTQITRLWPVDRAIIILALLLCSIGIISLKDIARSPITPGNQAKYALVALAGMFAGICGVLMHCYFENIFEEPYMMAYFWIMAAMLVYIGFFRRKNAKQ